LTLMLLLMVMIATCDARGMSKAEENAQKAVKQSRLANAKTTSEKIAAITENFVVADRNKPPVAAPGAELEWRRVQSPGDQDGPRLHLVENFATDAEIDHIMQKAFHHMKPQKQQAETGMVYELPVHQDNITRDVYHRMSSVFPGVGNTGRKATYDTFRVRRYLEAGKGFRGGDNHPPHTDWFQSTKGDTSYVLIISMILYLTTPEKGGTTFFPQKWDNGKKGYGFEPKRGHLAAWWSCHKNGTHDLDSTHESTPLLKGIKWNAARFFYDNVDKCSFPPANFVQVPKAAKHLRPQGDSTKTMFGFDFPKGVWVTPQGTSHGGTPPVSKYSTPVPHNVNKAKRDLEMARRNPVEVAQKRIAGANVPPPKAKTEEEPVYGMGMNNTRKEKQERERFIEAARQKPAEVASKRVMKMKGEL